MSNGKVAPHRNCEVRLVLAGTKPLATIEKSKDPYGYSMAIACGGAGMLHYKVTPTKDSPMGEVVISKSNNLINDYYWLLKYGVQQYGIKEYHRRMGRLFGYTEADVEAFIESEIHCDCTKCRGA